MATFVPPKKNTAYEFYVSVVSQANTKIMQVSPTMAAGDVKVSVDNGTANNITTLPVIGTSTHVLKCNLSNTEMNGDNITIIFSDAAGAEWCDLTVNIQTSARQIDDLCFPVTSGRGLDVTATGAAGIDWGNVENLTTTNALTNTTVGIVTTVTNQLTAAAVATGVWQDATAGDFTVASSIGKTLYIANIAPGGSGGLLISGSNAGTTTFGALTVTGATTFTGATAYTGNVAYADGLTIAAPSTLNRAGITVTGNGTGSGAIFTSGNGATGNALHLLANSTNGHGFFIQGSGGNNGIHAAGGLSAGDGFRCIGGTNGSGLGAFGVGTGNGVSINSGTGADAWGLWCNGRGSATSHGIRIDSAGAGGNGVNIATANGHGINIAPVGTSKHGIFSTGGNGGTSDGMSLVAGTGGVALRAPTITGNITGNLSGTTGGVTAAGAATFFTIDSGQTGGGAVTGSVVKEIVVEMPQPEDISLRVWQEGLPGAFLAGTGGFIVGTNVDALISSRMATYVQPTGFLAATFPGGTIANTTNITTVGAVSGNIGGNVTGTIGGFTTAALIQFFTTNTTKVYADAVAGSIVKETALGAAAAAPTLAQFFTVNTGQTYATAVDGSVVKEIDKGTGGVGVTM